MKRHIEELPYGTTLYTQLSEFRNPARIRKNTVRECPFEDDPYTCMQTNLIEDTAMKFRIFLLLCASLWGWNVRGQRMDTVARTPLETLARAPRSAVMVLRPFRRTFHRFPRTRRAVQHRRREKRDFIPRFRPLETLRLPLSGLVHRRRRRLRIRLDTRPALESRSRNRRWIRLHAI